MNTDRARTKAALEDMRAERKRLIDNGLNLAAKITQHLNPVINEFGGMDVIKVANFADVMVVQQAELFALEGNITRAEEYLHG